MTRRDDTPDAAQRRRRAEERLRQREGEGSSDPSATTDLAERGDPRDYAIELAMQNEELARSRAEEQKLVERYTELYDFAPVGYFTLGRDATVRQVNLTGAHLLGIDREGLVTRQLGLFLADDDRPAFNAAFERALGGSAKASCEVALAGAAAATNEICYVALTLSLTDDAKEVRAVAVNVTDRRRAEEMLRASQKLEAIGRLAGGVAHDFNNLLTIVLTNTDLALEELGADSPSRSGLLEVKTAATEAAKLTRQLLAFGQRQHLQPEAVDVNELLGALAGRLRVALGDGIALALSLATDLGHAEIDRAQLEYVIMDLAVNARDAMPAGGTLTISTANVEPASTQETARGPFLRIVVADTGVGMDPATAAKVFEPFFTSKDRERGTGFGLSAVYGIVKQCGGDVAVTSERGKGTAFEIHLRRTDTPPKGVPLPAAKVEPVTAVTNRASITILVVDDEDAIRRLAKRILAAVGYTVLLAAGGAEALRIGEEHPASICIALSDVIMPEMTGVVFAERLKKAHPETEVVYMSGYPDGALQHGGVTERPVHFIGKPFTAKSLTNKVREVLELSGKLVERR